MLHENIKLELKGEEFGPLGWMVRDPDIAAKLVFKQGKVTLKEAPEGANSGPIKGRSVKRLIDLSLTLCFIIAGALLFIVITFAIVLESILCPESAGPIFYGQKRFSSGECFQMKKFRTFYMSDNPKQDPLQETTMFINDRRLTYVGTLLRRFYLDELPQLYHVLIGEMSMVGPRPYPAVQYREAMGKGYEAKKILKGGICGPAQALKGVNHPFSNTLVAEELLLLLYRKNNLISNVFVDLRLTLATLNTALKGEGI